LVTRSLSLHPISAALNRGGIMSLKSQIRWWEAK